MQSNKYIIIYSTIMVVLVAVSLTFVAVGLKPLQEDNVRIEKMQNILSSVHINVPPKKAIATYQKYITEVMVINNAGEKVDGIDGFTVDMAVELKKPAEQQNLPVFIATLDDGKKYSIVPVRGKGLWGPIWGYIALTEDFNTIYGVTFDHKGETPGLGAEINTDMFKQPFNGKQIFDEQGNFTSVKVEKGGAAPGDIHGVDAISGGTITSKGLEKMLKDCLTSYEVYFKNKGTI
jgi:Na+-transporting NADH:ubiquinone oxidoreductase subunit C